jgi:hypothetical protein
VSPALAAQRRTGAFEREIVEPARVLIGGAVETRDVALRIVGASCNDKIHG